MRIQANWPPNARVRIFFFPRKPRSAEQSGEAVLNKSHSTSGRSKDLTEYFIINSTLTNERGNNDGNTVKIMQRSRK